MARNSIEIYWSSRECWNNLFYILKWIDVNINIILSKFKTNAKKKSFQNCILDERADGPINDMINSYNWAQAVLFIDSHSSIEFINSLMWKGFQFPIILILLLIWLHHIIFINKSYVFILIFRSNINFSNVGNWKLVSGDWRLRTNRFALFLYHCHD